MPEPGSSLIRFAIRCNTVPKSIYSCRQYEQLAAMKEKSRLISHDGAASQEHVRNLEAKLDQEKLGRQRAETQVKKKKK